MILPTGCSLFNFEGVAYRRVVNDFWLRNKHTISIFQAQVRDLAKHIEAQPKNTMLIKKKRVMFVFLFFTLPFLFYTSADPTPLRTLWLVF